MTTQTLNLPRSSRTRLLLVLAAVLVSVLWAYGSTLLEAAQRWSRDPQYSHGYLVPAFALTLLWLRRSLIPANWQTWSYWGAPVLALGLTIRLVGTYYHYVWLDPISLLPCLAGLCLLLGGWPALRWSWPAIGFLVFMIPLPHSVSVAMSSQLQRIATLASTFLLQLMSLPALAEGNTILLNDIQIGVVEACSGLRMLMVFFALSAGLALIVKRPLWEKLVILASAIPIALISNILRITATGLLHQMVSSDVANAFFHDFAGYIMPLPALLQLWLVLWVLDHLFMEAAPSRITRTMPPRPQAPVKRVSRQVSPAARPVRTAPRATAVATQPGDAIG